MIYVMAEDGVGDGPVKIGFTSGTVKVNSVKDRANQLQTGNHRRLVVVAMFDGNEDDERALHRRFAEAHVLGEWFRRTDTVAEFILTGACEPVQATSGARGPLERQGRGAPKPQPPDQLHYLEDGESRTVCGVGAWYSFVVGSTADWSDDDIDLERCSDCHRRVRVLTLPRKSATATEAVKDAAAVKP